MPQDTETDVDSARGPETGKHPPEKWKERIQLSQDDWLWTQFSWKRALESHNGKV